MKKIENLYCLFSQEEADGEGIIAKKEFLPRSNDSVWVPFICSDDELLDDMKREAANVSSKQKIKVKLVKFTVREELEEWDGRKLN